HALRDHVPLPLIQVHRRVAVSPLFPYTTLFRSRSFWLSLFAVHVSSRHETYAGRRVVENPLTDLTGQPLVTGTSSEPALSKESAVHAPRDWQAFAKGKLDSLTKPLGSLGRLEEIAARIVSIRELESPGCANKAVYVFAADHGVTEEGVSAYPKAVTQQMVRNFLANGAAINVFARCAGAEVIVVDVG